MNNMNEALDYNELCQKQKVNVTFNFDSEGLCRAVTDALNNLESDVEKLEMQKAQLLEEVNNLQEQKAQLLEDVHALRAYAEEMRNSFGVILGSMQKVFPG
ncbi:hypothetical protein [Escherichia coli]|uniref:hypothetical protein n=1 Tax=Escherichia coli TaxID=562 RepID=UPI0017F9664E|nr:hypothetical protein [Escherichia coli]EFM6520592.1 hypothetical protein [Escherichia coli]EIV9095342.1 hypothetical protein [Escherichia coli]HCL9682433.1 hypothetical protein [Escherichia coli]